MNALLEEIEARRLEADIPIVRLERMAGIGVSYYHFLRSGRYQGSDEVMRRLERALSRLAKGEEVGGDERARLHGDLIRMAIALICEAQGLEEAAVQSQRPEMRASGNAAWLKAAQVRAQAWSLVNNVFGLRGVEIARAAGISKAAVSLALRKVEECREDGAYDAQMARLERAIIGEGSW